MSSDGCWLNTIRYSEPLSMYIHTLYISSYLLIVELSESSHIYTSPNAVSLVLCTIHIHIHAYRTHVLVPQLKNADYFSQFVTEDFELYINRKRSDHSYGNNLEMQAMAEMYNRAIEVHQYSIGERRHVYNTSRAHSRLHSFIAIHIHTRITSYIIIHSV